MSDDLQRRFVRVRTVEVDGKGRYLDIFARAHEGTLRVTCPRTTKELTLRRDDCIALALSLANFQLSPAILADLIDESAGYYDREKATEFANLLRASRTMGGY